MKSTSQLLIAIILLFIMGCEKESDLPNIETDSLRSKSEHFFYLKSGQTIYTDKNDNKYYSLNFNSDTLNHIYSVLFEKNKKYNLSVSGNYCEAIDFYLLNANKDTLFYGEQGNVELTRKYIVWESDVTDTMFISISYNQDINFYSYQYNLTFEERTINTLQWDDFTLECSGDWFINSDNYLTLACHNSSYSKWAKIVDNSLYNYEFNIEVGLKTGIPDIYTGIAFFANENLSEMFNIPEKCYEFKILGPSTWEKWTRRDGGMGRDRGQTSTSLNRGVGSWNELKLKTFNDSLSLYVNSENVISFRNHQFMENGLLLVVDDQKNDTVYFKNIELKK